MFKSIAVKLDCNFQVITYFLRKLERMGVKPIFYFKDLDLTQDYISINPVGFNDERYVFASYIFNNVECVALSDLVEHKNCNSLTLDWDKLYQKGE